MADRNWSRTARRIRVSLGFAFAAVYLVLARPTRRSIAAGALVALPGLGLRALAAGHVKKNAEVTTTGPYAHTRNPLYLGSMILAAGFAVASRRPTVAIALVMLFTVIYIPTIRSEEEWLRTHFEGYPWYMERVPRLLPRLKAHPEVVGRSGASSAFSPGLYRRHREYNALLGALAMLGALAAKRALLR